MVDREFVEALRVMTKWVGQHSIADLPDDVQEAWSVCDDQVKRLAVAQPAEHPESIGGLASRTPASKQGKKALDDMLLVFAKHDDDEEDCWTQPARLGMQYVSDLEWDLETHVNRSAILAETNDTLRGFIDCLAAFTGTHFGADEPIKNYERVRKALTDKPEPPAAPAESAPLTHAEAKRLYDEAGADAVPFGKTEVERLVRRTVDPMGEIIALQKQRNDVYEERDRLVAALSKCFPSWLARHPDADKEWDDDWRWIVFVQLPTGQASWHIHDREFAWFKHLEVRFTNEWDGHTTEEKYARLERMDLSCEHKTIVPTNGDNSELEAFVSMHDGIPNRNASRELVWARELLERRKAEGPAPTASAQVETPTIEGCLDVFAAEAKRWLHLKSSAPPLILRPAAIEKGIAAVRDICLASRATPPDVLQWYVKSYAALDTIMVEHGLNKKATPEEAQAWLRERLASRAPSSRLVEAADAMRRTSDYGRPYPHTDVDEACAAYDAALAEHERSAR